MSNRPQPEPMMTTFLDTKTKPLATKLLKHLLWSYNETLGYPQIHIKLAQVLSESVPQFYTKLGTSYYTL